MKKVSAIIPVYNVEKYLKKCIDSILNQTYSNLEIILVDDGSTDSSGMICDEYKLKDDRIIVIHKPNGGVSSARNVALEIASGELLTFIDSDDYIESNHIKKMVELMERYNVDMSITGHTVAYEDGTGKVQNAEGEESVLNIEETLRFMLKPQFYCGFLCNKLYKMEIIRTNKISFNINVSIAEDLLFNCEYLFNCNLALYNPTPTYFYVQRSMSATNKMQLSEKKMSAFQAYEMVAEKCRERFSRVSRIACATIYNLSIHYIYFYYNEEKKNKELENFLKEKIKLYYRFFARSRDYTFQYKLMGMLARISPRLYYYVRKMKYKGKER